MERIEKSLILTVVTNLAFFIHPIYATSEAAAPQADVRLQQVALFKNGLGFFVLEVTVPEKQETLRIVPLVAPSHGTFWVSYPPKVKLESLTAKEIESEELVEAVTIPELLRANVGRKVRLYFSDIEKPMVEGTIKYFAEDREIPRPNPYAPGRWVDSTWGYRSWYYIQPPSQSRFMMIQTDDREVAIDPQNVNRVEFLDGKAEKTFTSKSKSMQLDVKMAAPAGGQKLTVSYLAKGITWAPSYIVDITEDNKARVSAKAVVINEVCDLDGVRVQLVTGFPHLKFAEVISPLALRENMAQFLEALARGESRWERTVGVMGYGVYGGGYGGYGGGGYGAGVPPPVMPEYGAAEEGEIAEDLFLYPVENVQLKRGETGYYPLFTESVPYKQIYQWKIPDYVDKSEHEADEEVWHCLRLENTTKVPWTTAAAEIVKDDRILGQDTLDYTAVKGKTTLRITQAVNVKAEQFELETERKREALILYGDTFDLITVEGKLSVTNFQQKAITLEITKTLSGKVKFSQPKAKIETLARGLRRMNAVRELTWTIEIKPGERKQLGYIYDVYVRR